MESKFLTELDAELADEDQIWIIKKPLIYQSEILNCVVEIPTGFQTDLASVPRVPIAYIAFGGRAHREGVLHDYLYRKDSAPVVTFMQANRVFLEAMKARGKSFFVRQSMFLGVCIGGYFSYHKKNVLDKI